MDSGNSGSLQSSSGGEEEYDSRGESSISSFLNSSPHFASISDPQSGQLLSSSSHHHHHHQHQQQPSLFINSNNAQNFDAAFSQSISGNSQFGNDLLWSRALRSEPNYSNFGNLTGLSSSSSLSSSTQSVLGPHVHHQVSLISNSSSIPTSTSMPPSHYSPTELQQVNNANPNRPASDHQPNISSSSTVKNPKKRTRASRRAPTTVLTTDTTNFRQMVQEFTGIPTAPFSSVSPYSRRLELFTTPSTMRSAAAGGHNSNLEALSGPLYPPLRPSPQKLQLNPFFPPSNSSQSPSLLNIDPTTTTSSTTTNAMITSNLLGLQKQPQQDLLNMHHNQMLSNFHQESSSLHPSLKHPTTTSSQPPASVLTRTKSQATATTTTTTTVPSFDDLGFSHHNQNVNANQLLAAGFPTHHHQPSSNNITTDQEQELGSSISSSSQQQRIYNSNKFNCSVSTSEFHPDKGLENVTTSAAGEGTVGSWICPSD